MYGQPIYSDGRASDPVQREQGARFLATLRADPPAGQTDNRFLQSQRYTGVPYAAINAILNLVEGCTYSVVRRKQKRVAKSVFLPGVVYKGTPTPNLHAHDEAYTPFEDVGHPLAAMVTHPNNEQTFGELTGDIVLQNRLTGVGPLWAVPNLAGRPVELWALKTALTYPLASISQRYPQGAWRVTPFASAGWAGTMPTGLSAAGAVIPGEEVKRFRDRHPLIDWDGFSPLTAEARQLDILEAIDESRWSAMTNGLQLDAVLVVPGAEQGALDRLSAQMTAKSGGSRNARKFLALATAAGGSPGDKATLQTFGQTLRDMDYREGWQQMTDFCLACFGVTSAAVGLKESTSYSELYASLRQFFWRQGQFVRRLADFYTRVLCRPWESFADEFRIQIDLPTLDDQELIDKRLGNDVNRLSVNEARALRNMPPVEHGEYPEPIYLKVLEKDALPEEPQPQPGEDAGQGGGDPLAALMGGTPTGGAVPSEDNDDAEGTLPPREVLKAILKAGFTGVITDKRGRKRHYVDGRPVKNPDKPKPQPRVKGPTKKDQALAAKQAKQQQSEASKAAVAAVAEKLARGGEGLTHEEVATFDAHLKTRTDAELKTILANLKQKVSGTKVQKADRLVELARKLKDGGGKAPEPAKPAAKGPAAKKPPAKKPAAPAKEPAVKEKPAKEPAAEAPAPAKPRAAPAAKPPKPAAYVPAGHEVVHDFGAGVVTAKDPKSGEMTTHFPPGLAEAAARKLAPAIGDAYDDARLDPDYSDGLVPLGLLAADVSRRTGASRGEVMAALSAMRSGTGLQGHAMNETQKLASSAPVDAGGGLGGATLWDRGRAVHWWITQRGKTGAQVAAEYLRQQPAGAKA